MKKLLFFIISTLFLTDGYAQEEYDEPEIGIDSLLVNIDKTGFTSGVLYERVFLAQLDVFNNTARISWLELD